MRVKPYILTQSMVIGLHVKLLVIESIWGEAWSTPEGEEWASPNINVLNFEILFFGVSFTWKDKGIKA